MSTKLQEDMAGRNDLGYLPGDEMFLGRNADGLTLP